MRMWKVYRIVFRKEFRELRRDRRALFWLFAPPIILPMIAICGGVFIGSQAVRIANDGFNVAIENGDLAPELVTKFENTDGVNIVTPPDPANDRFGEAVVVVAIPDDFLAQLENGTATIEILTRDNAVVSILGQSVSREVIEAYEQELVDQRLTDSGLTRADLDPIFIGERQTTANTDQSVVGRSDDAEENGSNSLVATIFLPLAVTSYLLGGGLGLILDTTVGEKERQTIENLLVTPASRIGVVMGKLSVVFLASLAVMSLWLIEGLILNALSVSGQELLNAEESLSMLDILETLLNSGSGLLGLIVVLVALILPFIIMLNGLMMAVCAYAANYREANLFMALTQLGLPATVLITVFSFPPEVADVIYAIPLMGTIVAIRDLFSDTLSISGALINIGTGIVYAFGGISVAAWVFNREWSLTRGLQ